MKIQDRSGSGTVWKLALSLCRINMNRYLNFALQASPQQIPEVGVSQLENIVPENELTFFAEPQVPWEDGHQTT